MVRLIANDPLDGLVPVQIGGVDLLAPEVGVITAIAPYDRSKTALSGALKGAHGLGFPAPNRTTGKGVTRCVWTGRCQAMLIGPTPDPALATHAALVDQSDAWAILRLQGAGALAVLGRLTPLDLRPDVFKTGHTARTELAHMMSSLTRVAAQTYDLMIMRSMVQTAVHDLTTAMRSMAALDG